MIKMKLIILFTRLYQMVQSPKFTLHLCIDLDNSTIIFLHCFGSKCLLKSKLNKVKMLCLLLLCKTSKLGQTVQVHVAYNYMALTSSDFKSNKPFIF